MLAQNHRTMNKRIAYLRQKSLDTTISISAERALLLTSFYKSLHPNQYSVPVQRAKSFAYLLEHKALYFDEQEWIVGERGPSPRACPTYPEICLHSLEDLQQLDARPKVAYKVDADVLNIYREKIIPYWTGISNRDRILASMKPDWKEAYEAGVFTEFQEQRGPGHTVLGHQMFEKGFLDLVDEIDKALQDLNTDQMEDALHKREELEAMKICAKAIIGYAKRYADMLQGIAKQQKDKKRKAELMELVRICRRVPAHAPSTFHEALQHYWFIHIGVISELNPWDSFSPGRLDQHLWPFYEQEINAGSLSEEHARELLQALWVKFHNHPAPPKMGVTAQESGTYTDFALINVGGLDENGRDASNELSYIILDVVEEMRLLQPSSMIQVSKKTPNRLINRALDIIKTGFGQPSIFNTDGIIMQLMRQGKSLVDARNGGASGCVETGAFGAEAYVLTGYLNLPKILEITLHRGVDPISRKQIGPKTPSPYYFQSFEDLMLAFELQLRHFIDTKIMGNHQIDRLFAHHLPVPFLSSLINDCISTGTDYHSGGARYNSSYIQGVGLGSITDALTAIRFHVFDHKDLSMKELIDMTDSNFIGNETWQYTLLTATPKYGNDDDYADQHAERVFNLFFNAVDGRPSFRGGEYRVNMLPTTCHVYFGSKMGASCDGREAFAPLSEGISPFQSCDIKGPTAVIRSAAKFDHLLTGGTLLNQKFSPSFFVGEENKARLTELIRTYFKMDGHHIQFNVVDMETLRAAQKEPEKYRDLIVRVAGYSDYFNDLGKELQDEIIARTAHQEMS